MTPRPSLSRRIVAAAATALALAALIYLTTVLAYYTAVQGQSSYLPTLFAIFGWTAVITAILAFVVAMIDGLARWLRSAVFGLVIAVFAAYIGDVVFEQASGVAFSAALTDATSEIYGVSLVPIILTVLFVALFGGRIQRFVLRAQEDAEVAIPTTVLVRRPAATLSKGQLTHIKRRPVRIAKAEEQWDAYVAALESEGFTAVEVERDNDYPDSVFIEDTVVMLGRVAVITSPGAESRRGEPEAVERTVAELGLEARHIRLPGTLDGGDVLKVGSTIYVGKGGRTNGEGIRQFRAIANEFGYEVIGVPVTRALHLKSTVTALPDGTVIGHPDLVDNPGIFPHYLEVPEPQGIAVIVLSASAVLIAASAPKTAELLEDLGYRVVRVDVGEFEKLEGCVTCLSVRIR